MWVSSRVGYNVGRQVGRQIQVLMVCLVLTLSVGHTTAANAEGGTINRHQENTGKADMVKRSVPCQPSPPLSPPTAPPLPRRISTCVRATADSLRYVLWEPTVQLRVRTSNLTTSKSQMLRKKQGPPIAKHAHVLAICSRSSAVASGVRPGSRGPRQQGQPTFPAPRFSTRQARWKLCCAPRRWRQNDHKHTYSSEGGSTTPVE